MIDPDLLAILRCPINGGKLQIADEALVRRIRTGIERGEVRDRLDQRVNETIDGGLVDEDRQWLFPIRRGIPALRLSQNVPQKPLWQDGQRLFVRTPRDPTMPATTRAFH